MKILGDGKVNIQMGSLINILKQENKNLCDWPKNPKYIKSVWEFICTTGMTQQNRFLRNHIFWVTPFFYIITLIELTTPLISIIRPLSNAGNGKKIGNKI